MYTFIALPNPNNSELRHLQSILGEVAEISVVPVPQFKIGTLDSLITTADELQKFDIAIESSTSKLVDSMRALLDNKEDQLKSSLLVNDKPVDAYLKSFAWNTIKYRVDKSVKEIAEAINQEISSIDSMVKNKLNSYSATKNALAGVERKQTGSLAVKSLVDVIKTEHVVLDSEYLRSVIVAVPNMSVQEFLSTYERMTAMVVPRSATKIASDSEYTLFSVVVFAKTHDEFVNKLRENKCIPRDFVFDEKLISQDKKELSDLGASVKEQWSLLLRLCRSNFGEIFSGWIHIKVLRVFVEAILRYGLPPNFLGAVLKPKPKQEKKMVDIMTKTYAKLASKAARGDLNSKNKKEPEDENVPEFMVDKNYCPYVSFDLKLPWEGSKSDY